MENPEALAGSHIESADIAFHVFPASWHSAGQVRGADDHHVAGHDGRGMKPDFSGDQINILIVVFFQIDHAAHAEAGHADAGLGIQRDEPVTRRDIQDSLFLAVGPIGQAMSRKLSRGIASRGRLHFRCASRAVRPWTASSATTALRVPPVE